MSIQGFLDKAALEMVPRTMAYLKELRKSNFYDDYVASDRERSILNAISNSAIPLDEMTQEQLKAFDNSQCEWLEGMVAADKEINKES